MNSKPFQFTANTFIFAHEIENIVWNYDVSYIEAVTKWCEEHNTEIEYIATFIKKDPVLCGKIQEEAENLRYIKKTAKLEFI
jgi:Phage late-transcription coactivator